MSNIENSGPGGVTKRYGALGLGGVVGSTGGNNGERQLVGEFSASEVAGVGSYDFVIPSAFGELAGGRLTVEKAFDAGTVDLQVDGVSILTAPVALTATGVIPLVVTATDIDPEKVVTFVVAGVTGTDGYAKAAVTLYQV